MKKIQTPNILKKIQRPKIKAPRIQGPKVQAPKFLSNLYRDLRDRRLLLPAGLLLLALIVVPIALSNSAATTSAPPLPETAGGSKQAAATTPAVLAEQLGVTDYQKRLEQLQSKNPFKRQYIDAPQDTGSASTSSGTTSSGSTVASPSDSTSPAPSSTSASTASQPPSTSGSSSPSVPSEPSEPVLFVFEADLAIGIPGDLSRRRHVELGKFLPSEAKPMVAFAGATEDMQHALFLVSADVSSVTGDGRCVPGEDNCTLLRLKVGEEAKLAYAPESDRIYKLRLMGIDLAPADANAANERNKRGVPLTFAAQAQD